MAHVETGHLATVTLKNGKALLWEWHRSNDGFGGWWKLLTVNGQPATQRDRMTYAQWSPTETPYVK